MGFKDRVLKGIAGKLNLPIQNTDTGAVVTAGHIRIIDLARHDDRIFLDNVLNISPHESGGFTDESAELVNNALEEAKMSAKTVCNLVTDNKYLFIRHVEVPEMEKEQAVEAIRVSEADSIPFNSENASIDAMILPEHTPTGDMNVLMAALDSEIMHKYHNFFKKTHLKHIGISTLPSALLALINESNIIDTEKPVPFISMGRGVTGIYIFYENDLKFTRDINFGGDSFTRAIATKYEVEGREETLSREEAEKIKETYGIPTGPDLLDINIRGITGQMIREKMQPALDKMVAEFGRSLDFFRNENRISDIPSVYLLGFPAEMKNLPEYLTNSLGSNAVAYNPFEDFLEVEKEELEKYRETGAGLTVAIGVALDQGKSLNLLSPQYRYSFQTLVKKSTPWASAAAIIFLVGGIYSLGAFYQYYLAERVQNLEQQVNEMVAQEQASDLLEQEKANILNQIREVDAILSISPDLKGRWINWTELMNGIADKVPVDVAMDSISIGFERAQDYAMDGKRFSKQLTMEGRSRGSASNQVKALKELLNNMDDSPDFQHVTLLASEQKMEGETNRRRLFFKVASDLEGDQSD